jgi:hypothetical protein
VFYLPAAPGASNQPDVVLTVPLDYVSRLTAPFALQQGVGSIRRIVPQFR